MSAPIRFNGTKEEDALIKRIADRYQALMLQHKFKVRRPDLDMDIAACHYNGCMLDLEKLLAFDDFNLSHDVTGIIRNLNRRTGKLGNFFLPRCSV